MEGTFHNHGEKHDGWVFIDPNQVSKFVSIRDVGASHVEALMESVMQFMLQARARVGAMRRVESACIRV